MSAYSGPERRKGAKNRRRNSDDRRHEDRLAEDPVPRRNPDRPDRRDTSN